MPGAVPDLEQEMTTVTITKGGFVKAVVSYDTSDADKALEIARMNYPQRGLKFRVDQN
jgi:hypothetical protein